MAKTKNFLARYNHQILWITLLIGAGLRWLHIGQHSFWYDEAVSSLIARLSMAEILANVMADDHPFGYYLLLHFWISLGQNEIVIRSLSALFSLATIPMVYSLGRWLFDQPTSTLAAVGTALSPFQVYYAQEVRTYGVLIFLSTALIWIFLYAVKRRGQWFVWLGYIFVAILALHFHYFVAFLLIGLHLWLILTWQQNQVVLKSLLLADVIIALLFIPQSGQALSRTTIYLTNAAWQPTPNMLSPLTTIYYLLFAHRTPVWLFPVALFLTLTSLILVLWEVRQRPKTVQQLELALWLSLLTPIIIVILISWLIRPIYLERSFAIGSTALILLLAHGALAGPRRSPTPYIIGLLALPIIVTLIANFTTPDPAKPPVREAAKLVADGFTGGDVSLHLQDSSYMPAIWYTPETPHLLTNISGALLTTVETHQAFGGEVVEWQVVLKDANRLWLTVMPGYTGPEQIEVYKTIEATYPKLITKDFGQVQVYLYDLRKTKNNGATIHEN